MLDAHYVLLHGLHSETRLAPCVVAVLVMLQPGSQAVDPPSTPMSIDHAPWSSTLHQHRWASSGLTRMARHSFVTPL